MTAFDPAACTALLALVGLVIIVASLASTDPGMLRGLLRPAEVPAAARYALRIEGGLNDVVLLPVVLVGMVFLAPAATAQVVPASTSTIESTLEPSGGSDGGRLIYVTNRSSQTIIVTSVRLTDCENIAGGCGVRRTNFKILPGRRTMVQAVRTRTPGESSFFRYGFTWDVEREEGPTARDIAADSTALTVDTVIVRPVLVELKEGETLDLRQVLAITARNAAGQPLPRFFFYTELTLGAEYAALRGGKLVGKAAGTAAFVVWASAVADPNAPRKGAVEVLVRVTP